MLLSTGNGDEPAGPSDAAQSPGEYGNAVVRLTVRPDGSLAESDFFIPYDANYLDTIDGDLGSGAPVLLPATPFSTATYPHMAVEIGKEGYLYLLNADDLGGYEQGANAGDAVIERLGPFGGVWGKPAVFGGNGGYVYLVDSSSIGGSGRLLAFKYGVNAQGQPTLAEVGQSADAFAYGSSSPMVTSAVSPNASGIVWVEWTPQTNSATGELRAYSAVPDASGTLDLIRSFPLTEGAEKMTEPLAYDNRIYLVGLTGTVYCFGAPVTTPLIAEPVFLPDTTVGQSSTATMTLTASGAQTVSSISSSDPQFVLGTPSRPLPASLASGASVTVPVTFTPTKVGEQGVVVDVGVGSTTFGVPVEGLGVAAGPQLSLLPGALSFGGTSPGDTVTSGITLADTGSAPLTIAGVTLPTAPFAAAGLPTAGTVLAPGQSITASVAFSPTAFGLFTGSVTVKAGAGGTSTIQLSGSSAAPAKLAVTPAILKFGSTALGVVTTKTFTVTNSGGTALEVTKSQPPVANAFRAASSLPEGTALSPGQTLTETVTFTPTTAKTYHDKWVINGTGSTGAVQVQLVGTGT